MLLSSMKSLSSLRSHDSITRLLNERIASKDALEYDPLFFHQEQYVQRKTKEDVDESDNPKVAARATKLISCWSPLRMKVTSSTPLCGTN
jgi:hypothetical protein